MQLSFVEGRNRMKLCNKISKGVAKGAEVICMLTIAALVLVIVVELLRPWASPLAGTCSCAASSSCGWPLSV